MSQQKACMYQVCCLMKLKRTGVACCTRLFKSFPYNVIQWPMSSPACSELLVMNARVLQLYQQAMVNTVPLRLLTDVISNENGAKSKETVSTVSKGRKIFSKGTKAFIHKHHAVSGLRLCKRIDFH